MATLFACLVVVFFWIVLGAAVIGLGRGTRRVVSGSAAGWGLADFWTGLAMTVALVLLAHLVFPIQSWLWIGLAPLAVAGLLLPPRPVVPRHRLTVVGAVLFVAVALYVADRALLPVGSYDSGLYHLPLLDWLHKYPAVPGLANFHDRFGFNTGSSIFDALVGTVVPASIAPHFANSLLTFVLLLEVLLAIVPLTRRGLTAQEYAPSIVLLLAAPALLAPLYNSWDISSPSPDLPAVVITLATAYYTARLLSARDVDAAVLVPAVALLALLPVMRLQLVVFTVVASLLVVLRLLLGRTVLAAPRRLLPRVVGMALLLLGVWVVHGYVLTGYPAFPETAFGLPVNWKVPPGYATNLTAVIKSWARQPGGNPAVVLHTSSWVQPWAARMIGDPEVRGMLMLVGIGVILFAAFAIHRLVTGASSVRQRLLAATGVATAVAVLGLVALTVIVRRGDRYALNLLKGGFVVALLTIALIAVVAVVATIRGDGRYDWSVPAALLGLAGAGTCLAWLILAPDPRFATGVLWLTAAVPAAGALSWLWTRRRGTALIALVVTLGFASSYPLHQAQRSHLLALVHAMPTGGKWGMSLAPKAPVHQVISLTGTKVNVPNTGDQCFADSLPCSPETDRPWKLRHSGSLGGGFSMTKDLPH